MRAIIALGALLLFPSFASAATPSPAPRHATPRPTPRPTPSPSPKPCGYVSLKPVSPPRWADGTAYERMGVTVSFPDGHTETAEFPYVWIYRNGEQIDPWSTANIRRGDYTVTLQLPPAGADVDTYPALIRYVLAHTDGSGYTSLVDCPKP